VLISHLLSFVDDLTESADIDRTPHAEWVVINTRIAILRALARCLLQEASSQHRMADGASLRDTLLATATALGKLSALQQWLFRLSLDATVLHMEGPKVQQHLRSPLLTSTSSLTILHVLAPMVEALPECLAAACFLHKCQSRVTHEPHANMVTYSTLFHLAMLHQFFCKNPPGCAQRKSVPLQALPNELNSKSTAVTRATASVPALKYIAALTVLADSELVAHEADARILLQELLVALHKQLWTKVEFSAEALRANARLLWSLCGCCAALDATHPALVYNTRKGLHPESTPSTHSLGQFILPTLSHVAIHALGESSGNVSAVDCSCAAALADCMRGATLFLRCRISCEQAIHAACVISGCALQQATGSCATLQAAIELLSMLRSFHNGDGSSVAPSEWDCSGSDELGKIEHLTEEACVEPLWLSVAAAQGVDMMAAVLASRDRLPHVVEHMALSLQFELARLATPACPTRAGHLDSPVDQACAISQCVHSVKGMHHVNLEYVCVCSAHPTRKTALFVG
jgi:hypothetical protein